MTSVKEKAFAKINLFLDVISKREDGFHEINTVMHAVSLCDDITVTILSKGKRGVRIFVDGNRKLPTDSKNLAFAAAKLFLERAMLDYEVGIKLVKRIPVAAGLAGGSSDAAAVLRAMNKLFSRPFGERMLLEMAAEIGSDVPFCLLGGTALCTGRGEKIKRLTASVRLYTVIAVANEHVSTPFAYGVLDDLYSDFDGSVQCTGSEKLQVLLEDLSFGRVRESGIFNIFEAAVLPSCSGAVMLKEKLMEMGASAAMMSGSGPSVFGIFSDCKSAKNAAELLNAEGLNAYYAESVM